MDPTIPSGAVIWECGADMFYCDPCAKKNDWPETLFRSRGPCEVCGKVASCNDLPSKSLPVALRTPPDSTTLK